MSHIYKGDNKKMKKQQFLTLLNKYLKNQASAEEANLLNAYYHLFMADPDVLDLLNYDDKEKLRSQIKAGIDAKIDEVSKSAPIKRQLWPRIAVVAAVLTAIVCSVFFFNVQRYFGGDKTDSSLETGHGELLETDIPPGRNTAYLTLGNGEVINLSDTRTGIVVNASSLKYNDNSQVIASKENDKSKGLSGTAQTLTAATPRGGTYQVTLPDGTNVWLNSDSKISFPSKFNGEKRKVLLDGEAYFEVAKAKNKPFIVESKGQLVEVLGTHFNINAYRDELSLKTTLLEGSVKVSREQKLEGRIKYFSEILKPNQQSIIKGTTTTVKTVKASETIAWKNGDFIFVDMGIEDIMKVLSRWYNIEVTYQGKVTKERFQAKISRHRSLSQVLKRLEETDLVHFKIEGRRVFVIE